MSHFSVAVFSRTLGEVDALLAPFAEDVDANSPYAVFEESKEAKYDPVAKKRGYWYNPNARWDWYRVGGGWAGKLCLKENRTGMYGSDYLADEVARLKPQFCDIALAKDCDFSSNSQRSKLHERYWEIAVEGQPLRPNENPEDFLVLYPPEYYIKRFGSKEKYVLAQCEFSTYAFVSADGEWYETGRMGWFGLDDATEESMQTYISKFKAYLQKAIDDGLYITIVDCHI